MGNVACYCGTSRVAQAANCIFSVIGFDMLENVAKLLYTQQNTAYIYNYNSHNGHALRLAGERIGKNAKVDTNSSINSSKARTSVRCIFDLHKQFPFPGKHIYIASHLTGPVLDLAGQERAGLVRTGLGLWLVSPGFLGASSTQPQWWPPLH